MKNFNRKKLVLALIKDDLTNWKMILTFNQLGFEADEYALNASCTILKLMRIKSKGIKWEEIHNGYLELAEKVLEIDVLESPDLVNVLSQEIYTFLKRQKAAEKANRIIQGN